jgi:benzoylformate decarboxylase
MNGIEALLEVLANAGVRHIFGNPGSTELPFNEALLQDPRFEYVLALHEIPAVAMAEGYAMATGTPGVVCLHISCGLGNAMGMLYNAHKAGSPLLVIAGQQDRRLRLGEPVLESDTVRVAQPYTKWAVEVQRTEDIPTATRRALQIAMTPPTGPVFLSLPLDIQTETLTSVDCSAPYTLDRRVRPSSSAMKSVVERLLQAKNPAILAGSRVTESSAVSELVAFAEMLGAPVYTEAATASGRQPFPTQHALHAGALPLWTPDIVATLKEYDLLFVVGMNLLTLYIYLEPEHPFPPNVSLIHLDCNAHEIGKNYPLEIGLLGDIGEGLREITQGLESNLTSEQRAASHHRQKAHTIAKQQHLAELHASLQKESEVAPMTARTLMYALHSVLPPDSAVVQEAPTTNQSLFEQLGTLRDPAHYFAHRGWALGWGLGCALGVKLGWKETPVLALLGDGASLYGFQGLWTAAHLQIPVLFLIANNREYKILKVCGDVLELPQMQQRNYLGMDIDSPSIDFVGLAQAFGVEAYRVTTPEEVKARVQDMLQNPRPVLLEAVIY